MQDITISYKVQTQQLQHFFFFLLAKDGEEGEWEHNDTNFSLLACLISISQQQAPPLRISNKKLNFIGLSA